MDEFEVGLDFGVEDVLDEEDESPLPADEEEPDEPEPLPEPLDPLAPLDPLEDDAGVAELDDARLSVR
ncbi:MAG: hypothetical protein AUG49_10035 [Catenulispora sp. 13_1_20CM_3_70_7]|nr:MAG: hypothetical protein AUG49_10035 [Catenulispora sp. 13_1_20CM_3_70_7]